MRNLPALLLAALLAGCASSPPPEPVVFRAALAALQRQTADAPLPKGKPGWIETTAPRMGLLRTGWVPSADGATESAYTVRVQGTVVEIQAWSRPAGKDAETRRRKDLEEALGAEILRIAKEE